MTFIITVWDRIQNERRAICLNHMFTRKFDSEIEAQRAIRLLKSNPRYEDYKIEKETD